MSGLQKNVASQNITFCLVNATSGAGLPGATVTVSITKDNGSQASGGGSVTDKGLGQYNYGPTQAETNATDIGFLFTATNAVPVNIDFHTDVVDANGFPTVNMGDIAGQTVTAAAGVTFPSSVASPTNITAGTITTVTNLTNAATAGDFTSTMKTSLNNSTPANITGAVTISGSSPLTESYAAQGAGLTVAQAFYGLTQQIGTMNIIGTTMTVLKRDNSTTAKTYTLNSATTPTSITEAT